MKKLQHNTVMLYEAVDSLDIKKNGIYIDGTFGRGGHSRLILSKLGINGRLIAIDRDPEAIKEGMNIKDPRFTIIKGNFSELKLYASKLDLIGKINGILLDLGVSSPQLDDCNRGFSFMNDGPLDMRMDPSTEISAENWLLNSSAKEIAYVLKTYGEEKFSKRIAYAISARNKILPITRTKELAKIITHSIPVKNKFKHPAKRSFQAIRIWINKELEALRIILARSLEILSFQGRLCTISFHSLEDRIVKNFIHDFSKPLQVPYGLPITEKQLIEISNIQLKSIGKLYPGYLEKNNNPRSHSAILRVAEKIC
ncbi:16S rRNA (cytosine(1402)-N(4))-methyltransferase [Candidatus Pantoea edessiphila]|uniref:Ribosomal RNA small subunit methyltransferase H n=1 Tax=Candidatus Pantoea edessiphila TaxID=2044610 RepID=A0A2P5SY36_9GAMM|nr:16S rRNA (cytosine(1402)-N(4))-methyltransferase RsmH [Candidatus Pantoea edessiphila]MBK4775595.1 16S rRNA (cytosine(1402)-N(4))-methyltransferase RsmH [Pantoea sp. Edef]PPI87244.1 16S rRNA (cytosine(1402)-N(4))-methyltransferase [Candidatus Pantoea edessiphila]